MRGTKQFGQKWTNAFLKYNFSFYYQPLVTWRMSILTLVKQMCGIQLENDTEGVLSYETNQRSVGSLSRMDKE